MDRHDYFVVLLTSQSNRVFPIGITASLCEFLLFMKVKHYLFVHSFYLQPVQILLCLYSLASVKVIYKHYIRIPPPNSLA
jgi:hypothetical protein